MSRRRDQQKKMARREREASDIALVPVDGTGELFAVYGAGDIASFAGLIPLTSLGDGKSLSDSLSLAVHGSNVLAQGLSGAMEAKGLVRLAPDSMKAMSDGARPLVKDGWNLGSLVGADGQISTQVRWLPAGGAQAAKVLAALGPAAALLAIQFKLGSIHRDVQRGLDLTHEVLLELRAERWAEIASVHRQVGKSLTMAQRVGKVTASSFQELTGQGFGMILDKNRMLSFQAVQAHRNKLDRCTGPVEHREYLRRNGRAILEDTQGVLLTEQAWIGYEALRAASRVEAASVDAAVAREMEMIVDDALEERRQRSALVEPLIQGIYQDVRLLEACPGSASWYQFGDKKRAPGQVAAAAKQLAGMLADTAGLSDPHISEAEVDWLDVDSRSELLQRFRWLLNRDERLVAVLWGSTGGPSLHWDKSGFLAFTDQRVVLLDKAPFLRDGSVRRSLLLRDLGPLTVSDRPGGNGGHDLVTQLEGRTIYLQASRGTTATDMQRLAALISSSQKEPQPATGLSKVTCDVPATDMSVRERRTDDPG